jgi:ribosomal protein L32
MLGLGDQTSSEKQQQQQQQKQQIKEPLKKCSFCSEKHNINFFCIYCFIRQAHKPSDSFISS